MEYWAHWDEEKKQKLSQHLMNTATLCKSYSVDKLKNIAYYCGLYHDLGKYTEDFQRKVNNPKITTSHSDCGAYELYRRIGRDDIPKIIAFLMAYCITGHHTGLKDGGSMGDNESDATVYAALKSGKNKNYAVFKTEIQNATFTKKDIEEFLSFFENCKDTKNQIELFAFLTKYIFSCLTDADFIETENFFEPKVTRGASADFVGALNAVDNYMTSFVKETDVQKARNVLQSQVWQNKDDDNNIFFLNMPTGSGKTLCSIRYALDKAIEFGKKRIIYVIPYTAIIEQTAKQFESIFGEYVPILQHHSNYDFEENNKENETTAEKLRKDTENWDHPLIVTTNIQFFQSVYGFKGRSLRKLHNMADSMIIFDEIHILPFKYLQPCLRAIYYICNFLSSKAVMMSATMPDYSEVFKIFSDSCKIGQFIKDKSAFSYFKKNRYSFLGNIDQEVLYTKISEYNNSLIVVNSRKKARDLYLFFSQAFEHSCYHLSTYMTAKDRSLTIEEIKSKIGKEKITVVSTSLIEVGVDLDFEAVFRETAGLDNILQAGGRCNREGKRKEGSVFVFDFDENINYRGDIVLNADIVRSLFKEYEDIGSQECIEEYYKRLFHFHKNEIENNTIATCKRIDSIPFRTYSESFKMIEDTSYGVVIPCEENQEYILRLKYGDNSVKRKLSKYTASVKFYELKEMVEEGIVEDVNGMPVLTNNDYYDKTTGLNLKNEVLYVL